MSWRTIRLPRRAAVLAAGFLLPVLLTALIRVIPGWPAPYSYQYVTLIALLSTIGGLVPGLLATALSTYAVVVVWEAQHGLGVALFPAVGLLLALAGERAIRAQDRMRHGEERFRFLADGAPVILWVTDAAGGLRFVNRTFRQFFGVSYGQVADDQWHPLLHPDDRAAYLRAFVEAVRDRKAFHAEARVRRADGAWRWVASYAEPILSADGGFLGHGGISPDITDRKQVEEALRYSAEREAEANRVKDQFLATLSHELRTPANVILGHSRVLSTRACMPNCPARPHVDHSLSVLDRNARLQMRLIEELLDTQRIVSGRLVIERTRCDLRQLAAAVIESLRPIGEAKRLHFKPNVEPVVIEGDAARIEQVIWNLLSNAIKFTPEAGSIALQVFQQNGHALIVVQDTGQGIPADFLPHLFERFTQLDTSTTREHHGLGLGLSIVKHVVELHGGTVTAASEGPGRGATFTVTLPLVPPEDAVPT